MSAGAAITLLDGGMGRELQPIDAPFRPPDWSALALIEAPERVFAPWREGLYQLGGASRAVA